MVYEWRIYDILPGRLPNIHRRFREHTMDLFKKHGIDVVIFFEKIEDDGKGQIQYLCSFDDMEVRNRAWEEFRNDPEWNKAKDESEADGPIVSAVTSTFLVPTDYSPV
jgi:hypothetical protein